MKKNFMHVSILGLLSTFILVAPASQASDTPSLFNAVLEKQAKATTSEPSVMTSTIPSDAHINQQFNSLSHAVLAQQGVKQNILINSGSEISYSSIDPRSEKNNSLFHGALAKQFKHTQ